MQLCPYYDGELQLCKVSDKPPDFYGDEQYKRFCSSSLKTWIYCHENIIGELKKNNFKNIVDLDLIKSEEYKSLKSMSGQKLVDLILFLNLADTNNCSKCKKTPYRVGKAKENTKLCWDHNIKVQKTLFMMETVHHFANSDNLSPFTFVKGTHGPLSDGVTRHLINRRMSTAEWLSIKSRSDLGLGQSAYGLVQKLVNTYFTMESRELELLTSEIVKFQEEKIIPKSKYLILDVQTSPLILFRTHFNEKYEEKQWGDPENDWTLLDKPLEEAFLELREIGYVYSKILGFGSSAVVFLVEKVDRDQAIAHERYKVVKFPRPTQGQFKLSNLTAIRSEADKLAKLHHPNVVSVVHIGTIKARVGSKEENLTWFIMDYIEGAKELSEFVSNEMAPFYPKEKPGVGLEDFVKGDVGSEKKKPTFAFSFENFIQIFRDVGEGLFYLHNEGIVHLDVKPGNILIAKNPSTGTCHAFISDLGYSVYRNQYENKQGSTTLAKVNVRCDYEVAPPYFKSGLFKGYSRQNMVYALDVDTLKEFGETFDLYELGKTMKILFDIIDKFLNQFELLDDWIDVYRKRYLYIIIGRLLANSIFPELQENSTDINEYGDYLSRLNVVSAKQLKFNSVSEYLSDVDKMNNKIPLTTILPEASILDSEAIRLLNIGGSQLMAPLSNRVKNLVDDNKFARLSGVSQLGFVRLVYPGATHSRFEHSIGVYFLTLQYIIALWNDSLNPLFKSIMRKEDLELAVLVALFHDVGYFPMAHDLEDTSFKYPKKNLGRLKLHEQIALDIIPLFKDILIDKWSVTVEDICSIISTNGPEFKKNEFRWRLISSMLNGVIDADKLDYIYRDCRHLGLPYAEGIDRSQLIRNLTIEYSVNTEIGQDGKEVKIQEGPEIAVKEKGRIAAEMLSFARYAMFSVAYWHHTVRILKRMLRFVVEEIPATNIPNVISYIQDYEKTINAGQNMEKLWGKTLGHTDKEFLLVLKNNTSKEGVVMINNILERKLYKRIKVYNHTETEFNGLQSVDLSSLEGQLSGILKTELERIGKLADVVEIGVPLLLIDRPVMQKTATLFTVGEDDEVRFRAFESDVIKMIYRSILTGLSKIRLLIPYHIWEVLNEKQRWRLRQKISDAISQASARDFRS